MRTHTGGSVRSLQAVIALLLAATLPATSNAQDVVDRIRGERLAVLSFINDTGEPEFDSVTASISEALDRILRWSRQYDVRELPQFDPFAPDGRTRMARQAREQRIPVVVFGRVVHGTGGRIELESAVYSTEEARIIGGTRREAFGAFDIVEAADELILTTASALLGYNVELGAIVFTPSRSDVSYTVTIDGVSLGENVRVVPQVLTGRRTVEVMIQTTRGEVPAYTAERLIRPGEALEIPIALPAVTRMEQEEILVRQGIARRLLGEPRDYPWAMEALAESAGILQRTESTALDPFRQEQNRLAAVWELDREYARLEPHHFSRGSDTYQPGDPLPVLPDTVRIRESVLVQDERVAVRVHRNAHAQYQLTWLRWAEALGEYRWDEAERILADLATLEQHYRLDDQTQARQIRSRFGEAREEAATLALRRRRPWPYLSLGVGLGGIGFGSYLYATDELDNYSGTDREIVEWTQWGSIGAGAVISLASIVRIISNNRAGEVYLREWAREEQGRLIDTAERVFELSRDGSERAWALLLGPVGEMLTLENRPAQFPVLLEVRDGLPVPTGRAPVVAEEADRLMTPGLTILTVQ